MDVTTMSDDQLTRDAVAATARRIAPYVRKTPVIEVAIEGVARPVTLKLEMLQYAGSFKARGAFANLTGPGVDKAAGVAAASGGNHGAAVAYAARQMGVAAHIFVPEISAAAKIGRIRAYGADVVVGGANYAVALAACEDFTAQSGAAQVHAYDTMATLLGQATLGLELEQQAGDLDTVLIAAGGGGLIGGVAGWYGGRCTVIGVEPATCNSLHAAMAAGGPVSVTPSGIAADSLGASSAGGLMYATSSRFIDRVVLVSDDDIINAQRWLWQNLRLVTEPGGAAALAGLLSGACRSGKDEKVGVVLCGANTDPDTFAKVIG